MRALSSAELLDVWEQGAGLHPVDQGLLVLRAALPEVASDSFAACPLGRRNRYLFALRAASFGARLEGWAECAHCGEKMEFEIDSRALVTHAGEGDDRRTVTAGGDEFHLPTSRDVAAVAGEAELSSAALRLLQRCRLGGATAPQWTEEEIGQIENAMAVADPLAETRLSLQCPACGREAEETLDIAGFVWSEIANRARRLLWEIHSLASAYGWTEGQILALGPARRAGYLEMVQA